MKFYGGPWHGRRAQVTKIRIAVSFRMMPYPVLDFAASLDEMLQTTVETRTYVRERYCERRCDPRRFRELRFMLLEGAPLLDHEHYDLECDLRRLPWCVEEASILGDFPQWFAAAVYRHTGRLWWCGGFTGP